MIKIVKLEVSQNSPTYFLVKWYLEPTIEQLTDYVVNVYRSELPSSNLVDYTLLTTTSLPASEYTEYYDTSVDGLINKFDTMTYLIQVINLTTNGTITSDPVKATVASDNVARRIIQLREIVLKRKSGAFFKILKRKTYGTLCPVCYDSTLQLTTNSKCTTCYDTKFVGGFYTPYIVRAQCNNAPPRSVITTYGDWQDQDAIMVMSNKPVLSPSDIIIDPLGKRWNIVTIRSTNKSYFLIAQQPQIRQIETDSVLYSVPG
jgi:hypothetical protein